MKNSEKDREKTKKAEKSTETEADSIRSNQSTNSADSVSPAAKKGDKLSRNAEEGPTTVNSILSNLCFFPLNFPLLSLRPRGRMNIVLTHVTAVA